MPNEMKLPERPSQQDWGDFVNNQDQQAPSSQSEPGRDWRPLPPPGMQQNMPPGVLRPGLNPDNSAMPAMVEPRANDASPESRRAHWSQKHWTHGDAIGGDQTGIPPMMPVELNLEAVQGRDMPEPRQVVGPMTAQANAAAEYAAAMKAEAEWAASHRKNVEKRVAQEQRREDWGKFVNNQD